MKKRGNNQSNLKVLIMEMREVSMTGINDEMQNLLKGLNLDLDEDQEIEEGDLEKQVSYNSDDDLADNSYLKDEMHPDLSIFGAEGQLLYQDIVDGDLTEHDDVLNTIFQQSKAAARLHLIQIKQRLIAERESALQTSERHNQRLIEIKNDEIEALKRQLALTKAELDKSIVKHDVMIDKIPPLLVRSRVYYLADFSVQKIFSNWKKLVNEQKKEIQLEKFAVIMKRRSTLSQTFAKINRENARNKYSKLVADHKINIDRVTREIVESYENELNRLRSDSVEAHKTARHEQLRRKQLEEDLRRMLLKNMTAMNFEALSLFQHTTVPSAVEQQQSMGELKDIMLNTAEISVIERENKRSFLNTPFTSNTNISRNTNEPDKQHLQQQRDLFDDETETPRRIQPMPSSSSAGPPRSGGSTRPGPTRTPLGTKSTQPSSSHQ